MFYFCVSARFAALSFFSFPPFCSIWIKAASVCCVRYIASPSFSAKGDDYELFCGMTEYTSMYIETECKISYEQSQIVFEELREF